MAVKIDFVSALHAASDTTSSATIVSKIVVGANGNVFLGNFGGWDGVGSSLYDDSASEISICEAAQSVFIADGGTTALLTQISAIDGTITNYTTGGVGQPPTGARGCALYRNRLVLYRTETDVGNWFMSAMGDYGTFDYTDETDTGAVAGNNSDAGTLPDEMTAFIAHSDDFAVMGAQDSVWLMRGDPHAGGRVDNLIRGGGIVGQFAHARDSVGSIFYMSRTDLMMVPPDGGVPQSISQGRLNKFLRDIDFSAVTVRMAWDAQNKGLWIFFCQAASSVHLHWSQSLDAFTTHNFPDAHGPNAVRSLSGDVLSDRQVLLGGYDGQLRTFHPGWTTDDGTAITSYLNFTPIALGGEPGERGIITETETVLGVNNYSYVTQQWYVGDNAQEAVLAAVAATSPVIADGTDTMGRNLLRARARGQTGVFRLYNNVLGRSWAFEGGHILVSPAGRTR